MTTFALVFILLLPGMSAPDVKKLPMESLEACTAKVAEMHEKLKLHAGEAYVYALACEVTGTKADPA